ncbi:hypothetical protein DO021_17650 [Desulfobacter hydrogenophilus]|uniref:Uncharacterized protein n=1 Tax=Desulfobacter hydrogenophilus TaxID=2291 RepID=A0A328F8M0_9BACT|nr:hypothetical protein [Desulfobacter hydrogenophilus]NDY73503.1 hypothetical protein [Desulfobacter hydrogenophilus]QBH15726.1 hypothetical protein EYB58_22915 [Desulfobacter hydrogenophilus]RAM00699.1 hypothetical protein DO021_17650 [Desulfobacter hydrogenophilus]
MKKTQLRLNKESWEKGYQDGLNMNQEIPKGIEILSWHFGYIEGQTAAKEKRLHQGKDQEIKS